MGHFDWKDGGHGGHGLDTWTDELKENLYKVVTFQPPVSFITLAAATGALPSK